MVEIQVSENANTQIESAIAQWLSESLALVGSKRVIDDHIDAILQQEIPTSEAVEVSIEAFRVLLRLLKQMSTPAQPALVIPLESISKEITQAVPRDMEDLKSQLSIEPPSLFLLSWESAKIKALCEEYSTPLPFALFNPIPEGVYVSYTEIRFAMGIEGDWEFSRDIIAEFYPLGIRMQ